MQEKELYRNILEEEEGIDIRKWFYLILNNWLIFVFFIGVSLFVAFTINRYSINQYQLSTSILIKENTNPLDKTNLVRVSLGSDPYRLKNEMGILTSNSVIKRTIKQLDFFTEYYQKRGFGYFELYNNCPFSIVLDSSRAQPINVSFQLEYLTDSLVFIESEGEDVALYDYPNWEIEAVLSKFSYKDTNKVGEFIEHNDFRFAVQPNYLGIHEGYKDESYRFCFKNLTALAHRYSIVEVDIPNNSSIMTVSMKHTNPVKSALFMNTLIDNYLLKGIERENDVAQRTIDFIDFQLVTLVDSLKNSEQKLQDFRSSNQLVDIDYQAQQAYTRQNELDRQKAEQTVKIRYLDYLKENLSTNELKLQELIAPSTMGISDVVLNNLVIELVELYNERTELTFNTKKNTPYINSIDARIDALKVKLSETVQNIYDATKISMSETQSQLKTVSTTLSKLPIEQRELLKFERKYQLNDELYTYLLTRRSEMQIKKASNLPTNEILEEADPVEAVLVSPNKKMNYIIAFVLGLFIPFIIIYIRELLNNRIQNPEDIKAITDIPIIASIYENENHEIPVNINAANSLIAESFRILRANMQFVLAEDCNAVLVVTSAMQGEGKSFCAINYAAVLASYKRKVCLVDLDLRRPKLANYLKLDFDKGMSNYLIGREKKEDIIHPVFDGLFDVIVSGPIPPNPSELIASEHLEGLIKELKETYDIVIIDSPPIGLVSDTTIIGRIAKYMLLVVRYNVTGKHILTSVLEEIQRFKKKGLNLIFNDVPVKIKGYSKYGSRYGYYYTSKRKGIFSRLS